MLYLLALLAPPLAVLMAGKFWHAVLNFCMCCTILLIPVAMVHAWLMVATSYTPQIGGNVYVNTNLHNNAPSWGGKDISAPRRKLRVKRKEDRTQRRDW